MVHLATNRTIFYACKLSRLFWYEWWHHLSGIHGEWLVQGCGLIGWWHLLLWLEDVKVSRWWFVDSLFVCELVILLRSVFVFLVVQGCSSRSLHSWMKLVCTFSLSWRDPGSFKTFQVSSHPFLGSCCISKWRLLFRSTFVLYGKYYRSICSFTLLFALRYFSKLKVYSNRLPIVCLSFP